MLDLRRFTPCCGRSLVSTLCSSEDWSLGDLGLASLPSVPPLASSGLLLEVACWAARSLREALPRFLRSRTYSQVRPNSTQCAQGVLPSHLVRSWLHWSHARLMRRLTGCPLLALRPGFLSPCNEPFMLSAPKLWRCFIAGRSPVFTPCNACGGCGRCICCSAYSEPSARVSNPLDMCCCGM